jgi:2-polyprenyl-6-hydroxyphenyl methylase/3-demethylubiquinone-9 3-methyltransferase
MWQALDNALLPVAEGGKLFISIYNDTGSQSARWKWIKRTYNNLPKFLRLPFTLVVIAPREARAVARALLTLRLGQYVESWGNVSRDRGMSRWHDIVDWVGGYPYEAATPEEIFEFYKARGFSLSGLKCGRVGLGCNEFVFVRESSQVKSEGGPVDLHSYRGVANRRDFKPNGNGVSKSNSTAARRIGGSE